MSHEKCSKGVSIDVLVVILTFSSCSNTEMQFCELRTYFPITSTIFRNTYLTVVDPGLSLETLFLSNCVLTPSGGEASKGGP